MMKILTKAEIYRRMERFWQDEDRTLSIQMFAEFCGLSPSLLYRVFHDKTLPMTEHTQICVSRALERMARGDVVMVYGRDQRRRLLYRQEPKPRVVKANTLTIKDGKIGLKVGLKNKSDYSDPTFEEELTAGGRNGNSA
jgi:hypothetical protein